MTIIQFFKHSLFPIVVFTLVFGLIPITATNPILTIIVFGLVLFIWERLLVAVGHRGGWITINYYYLVIGIIFGTILVFTGFYVLNTLITSPKPYINVITALVLILVLEIILYIGAQKLHLG